jgi:hypothetical protein
MKINIEELKTWISALRSGNYEQGKGNLQTNKGFCCLGVACKVLIPVDQQKLNANGFLHGSLPDDQPNAPEWLQEIDDNFREKTGKRLVSLNDYENYSFDEIANLLEKNYLTSNTEENGN